MTKKQLVRELRRITGDSRQSLNRLGFQLKPFPGIRVPSIKRVVNNPR